MGRALRSGQTNPGLSIPQEGYKKLMEYYHPLMKQNSPNYMLSPNDFFPGRPVYIPPNIPGGPLDGNPFGDSGQAKWDTLVIDLDGDGFEITSLEDGKTTKSELFSLEQLGISKLYLDNKISSNIDEDGNTQNRLGVL